MKPLWEFVGLEDARIVKWDGKWYLCGVRRDTTTHGQGRMELSQIEITDQHVVEVTRERIPAPGTNDSYCEKNWMPILDQPFHFIKWSNPVEIVKYDPSTKTTKTVYLGDRNYFNDDPRGGSQAIPFENGYLTLTHETELFKSEAGKKNAIYRHRLVHWSKDWIPLRKSNAFSFMDAKIEFTCGMAVHGDDILMTFGYQDNAAYILKTPKNVVKDYMNA